MTFASSAYAGCSNGSINGTFGALTQGALGGANSGLGNGVLQIFFDGNGNLTQTTSTWVSYGPSGWKIQTGSQSGTYSVAKDCTGTATLLNLDGSINSQNNFVIDSGKTGGQFIQLSNSGGSFEQTGFIEFQGYATCGLLGYTQKYAANLSGKALGFGPIGYVGLVILDGSGNISGSMTVNLNGATASAPITGTYTANADCTGTAAISAPGGPIHLNFVSVKSGKALLAVETDTNTVVSGTMQLAQ